MTQFIISNTFLVKTKCFSPFAKKKTTNSGLLVTALPCRLQNDSPPNSINEINLIESIDSNGNEKVQQRTSERNNLLKPSKLPLVIEKTIDESNYVNLNVLTAKCKAISEEYARSTAINESKSNVDVDSANQNKMNNFYLQMNSSSVKGPAIPNKSMLSIINQKNLNNLNGNVHSTTPTCNALNNLNGNGYSEFIENLNDFTNNNNNNSSTNCNSSLSTDPISDTKIGSTTHSQTINNNVDFNKNGLPVIPPTHLQNDCVNGHQTQGTNNKIQHSNGNTQQTYVIHNGNGLLTNGNNNIKDLPKTPEINKGKLLPHVCVCVCYCFILLVMKRYVKFDEFK